MKRNVTILSLGVLLLAAAMMQAESPTNPTVVSGSATFRQEGGNWTIVTSGNTEISWQDFGVSQGSTVNFVQPSSSSTVVNRVWGGQMSWINGMLMSNGRVVLINPAGIGIGATGQVNVASFLATTMGQVDSQEFFHGGSIHFTGDSSAPILNLGKVEAVGGDVYLVAANVVNKGYLHATGRVGMIAAKDVLLTQDGGIFIQPSESVLSAEPSEIGVMNEGMVEAAQIDMQACGGNVYALAVNNQGVLRATGTTLSNGKVCLRSDGGTVANSGEIFASNADGTGGDVQMLGDQVELMGMIDVSGPNGGGNAYLGGSPRGDGPLPNASVAYVAPEAEIHADATGNGDGGSVIVYGEDAAFAHGLLTARGGSQGGNGGFIETSAGYVNLAGIRVETSAPAGQAGTYLIDPISIEIGAGATSGGSLGGPPIVWNDDGAPGSFISVADLIFALGFGNVTIETDPATGGPGNITFTSDLTWGNDHQLKLDAHGNISTAVGVAVRSEAQGMLYLDAGAGIGSVANPFTAEVNRMTVVNSSSDGVYIQNTNPGTLPLTPAGGQYAWIALGDTGRSAGNGPISITYSGNTSVRLQGEGLKTPGLTSSLSVAPISAATSGNLSILEVSAPGTARGVQGDISVTSNGDLFFGSQTTLGRGPRLISVAGTFAIQSTGGDVYLLDNTALMTTGQPFSITSTGNVTFGSTSSAYASIETAGGDVTITAGGTLIKTGTQNYDGQILANLRVGGVVVDPGAVTITAGAYDPAGPPPSDPSNPLYQGEIPSDASLTERIVRNQLYIDGDVTIVPPGPTPDDGGLIAAVEPPIWWDLYTRPYEYGEERGTDNVAATVVPGATGTGTLGQVNTWMTEVGWQNLKQGFTLR
jgi:filamentous hemagglutinin family protein